MANTTKASVRRYTTEEKQKIVRRSEEVGPVQAAKEFEIGTTTMFKWRRAAKATGSLILPLNHADSTIKKAITDVEANLKKLRESILHENGYIDSIKARISSRQQEQLQDEQELAQRNDNMLILQQQLKAREAYLGAINTQEKDTSTIN